MESRRGWGKQRLWAIVHGGGEQNSKTYSRGRTLSLTGALWPVETRLKTPAPGPLWPADGLVSGDLCLIRTRSEALWPEVATVL